MIRKTLHRFGFALPRPTKRREHNRPVKARLAVESLEERDLLSSVPLDPTFGAGGVSVSRVALTANRVVVQPDGKTLAAGTGVANPAYGGSAGVVSRYNPDGSVDPATAPAIQQRYAEQLTQAELLDQDQMGGWYSLHNGEMSFIGDQFGGQNIGPFSLLEFPMAAFAIGWLVVLARSLGLWPRGSPGSPPG